MKGFICVYRGCIQNSQRSHFLIKLNKLLVFIGSRRCIQLPNEYLKKSRCAVAIKPFALRKLSRWCWLYRIHRWKIMRASYLVCILNLVMAASVAQGTVWSFIAFHDLYFKRMGGKSPVSTNIENNTK